MRKIIIIVLAVSLVLGFLFWKFAPFGSKTPLNNSADLTIWGLWEDGSYIQGVIDAYQKLNPNVKIHYVHQSSVNYRNRVQTQITSNQGPDILMIHNSWLPMFLKANSLSPMPSSVMSMSEYSSTFYPVAKDSFVANNNIYALPLEIDGLALYINTDLLKNIGADVPKTWPDLINTATKLTVKDTDGNIQTAGAALGGVANVDFWPDILGLLFSQQPDTDIKNPTSKYSAQVLSFYTSFITDPRHKTWDQTLETSTQAFQEGKLAFYFAPSWKAQEIRTASPNLNFKIAPVPQLPGNKVVGWASFWAFGVSSASPSKEAAWQFLKYLTSAASEQLVYQTEAKTRLFGEPYSRVDLAPQISSDPLAGAFVTQGPYYKGGILSSRTFDSGINDETIKYYEDALNSILSQNAGSTTVLQTVAKGVQQVVGKYTPSTPAPSGQ